MPFIGNLFGIEALKSNILASKFGAQVGVLIVAIWQGVAIPTVLVLSALQNVPTELIESAKLDGASKWQVFLASYHTFYFFLHFP